MLLKCQYNKVFKYIFNKNYFSQLYKRNEDKTYLNHLQKFDGKNIKRKNDYLEFMQGKFYESSSSKNYIVYKTNSKIPRLLIGCLVLLGLNIFLIYYLTKNKITKIKALLLILNLLVMWKVFRSNAWQIKKYIKSIELSKDLNNVFITNYAGKTLTYASEDIFLKKNSYFYIVQYDFLRSVCAEITIQGGNNFVQLNNVLIPDKDVFSAVLKGYKLKKSS
jgi:hypothetical protein